MPDVMRAFCPIDGLLLGSKNVTNQLRNEMKDKGQRQHAVWDFAFSVQCTNGHQWAADGRMEMRWDPSDPVFV